MESRFGASVWVLDGCPNVVVTLCTTQDPIPFSGGGQGNSQRYPVVGSKERGRWSTLLLKG